MAATMLGISRRTVRSSWRSYAGAFAALTFGIVLISITVTLIGAVAVTEDRAGANADLRAQLNDLSAMFGMMSTISLFMALFVVASTFGFVVATRQRELGLLRLVGATPRQIRRMLNGEAGVVALAAAITGAGLGTALGPVALWAVRAVGATTLHLEGPPVWLSWTIAVPAGVVVALLGCRRAARRAGRVSPVTALREAAMEQSRPGVIAYLMGLIALGAMVTLTVLAGRLTPLVAGIVGIMLPIVVVIAFTALGTAIVPRIAKLLARPFAGRSVGARLAADELRGSVRTTSSVAAPVTALAAIAGSLLLTMSFTTDWATGLDRAQLAAPVVVTTSAPAARLAGDPLVGAVDSRRTVPLTVGDDGVEQADVIDVRLAEQSRRLRAVRGDLSRLHGHAIAVSESWTFDSGVSLGGSVRARLHGVAMRLTVVAVVPDAPDLYGDVMVPTDLAGDLAGAPSVLFVSPAEGVSDAALLHRARRIAGTSAVSADAWIDGLDASARRMNGIVLLVLLGPAGIYAGIAIVNATLIGAAQRSRQRHLLALLGATPRQVRSAARWQAVLTTGAGLVLGGATTLFTGWLLRQAIARDLRGHHVAMTIPWLPLAVIAAICVGLALLAARAAVRAPGVQR